MKIANIPGCCCLGGLVFVPGTTTDNFVRLNLYDYESGSFVKTVKILEIPAVTGFYERIFLLSAYAECTHDKVFFPFTLRHTDGITAEDFTYENLNYLAVYYYGSETIHIVKLLELDDPSMVVGDCCVDQSGDHCYVGFRIIPSAFLNPAEPSVGYYSKAAPIYKLDIDGEKITEFSTGFDQYGAGFQINDMYVDNSDRLLVTVRSATSTVKSSEANPDDPTQFRYLYYWPESALLNLTEGKTYYMNRSRDDQPGVYPDCAPLFHTVTSDDEGNIYIGAKGYYDGYIYPEDYTNFPNEGHLWETNQNPYRIYCDTNFPPELALYKLKPGSYTQTYADWERLLPGIKYYPTNLSGIAVKFFLYKLRMTERKSLTYTVAYGDYLPRSEWALVQYPYDVSHNGLVKTLFDNGLTFNSNIMPDYPTYLNMTLAPFGAVMRRYLPLSHHRLCQCYDNYNYRNFSAFFQDGLQTSFHIADLILSNGFVGIDEEGNQFFFEGERQTNVKSTGLDNELAANDFNQNSINNYWVRRRYAVAPDPAFPEAIPP